jgi:N-acetylglucosaminyldiphosphoundecaprenol N-acetyl-beta-D-mannosaminyltransferase
VGFGAPKQEKWIYKWLPKLRVGGAMAVGGTFAYLSGQSKLPPKWMEERGLEWLWRLLNEPRRALRILKAVILFPLKISWYKFHQKPLWLGKN